MFSLTKKHEYLICVDSDGTVMDTMVLKHKNALGPALVEIFKFDKPSKDIIDSWVELNCFSKYRGYNRLYTLDLFLTSLRSEGFLIDGLDSYHNFVNNTNSLSILALEEFIKTDDSPCLKLALQWSRRCNELIEKLPKADYFKNSKKIIKQLVTNSDLVGVSTANFIALNSEWNSIGIASYFSAICSQECGTKESVIKQALAKGYKKTNAIIIGDSNGDLKAAQNTGIWFYPIIPNKENESWDQFYEDAYIRLINNTFDDEYQQELISRYKQSLK